MEIIGIVISSAFSLLIVGAIAAAIVFALAFIFKWGFLVVPACLINGIVGKCVRKKKKPSSKKKKGS